MEVFGFVFLGFLKKMFFFFDFLFFFGRRSFGEDFAEAFWRVLESFGGFWREGMCRLFVGFCKSVALVFLFARGVVGWP